MEVVEHGVGNVDRERADRFRIAGRVLGELHRGRGAGAGDGNGRGFDGACRGEPRDEKEAGTPENAGLEASAPAGAPSGVPAGRPGGERSVCIPHGPGRTPWVDRAMR